MFDHYRVFTEQVVSRSMAWTLLWESRNLSLLTQSHNCSDSTPPTTSWHLLSLLRFLCGIMLWCDAVQAFSAFSGRRVDRAIYFLYFFWFNMFWILGFISRSISKLAAMYFICFFCDSVLNWIVFKFLIVCNPSTQLIQKGFRFHPSPKLLWFEIHKGWRMI